MVIQYWIIVGLIVGSLLGMLIGKGLGIAGDIILYMICALVGGCLASILFVVSGAVNANIFAAIIAFSAAAFLLWIKRVFAGPSRSSA